VLAALAGAGASVRLVRSPHPLYPLSIVLGYTVATDCWLKVCPVFSTALCYCVCLADVLVTIPIDDRHCFTQRFSPTGFILNAVDSNCCHPIASARIQVKTYPFN
jgi:hypothetical protein